MDANFGIAVASAGDINGDGFSDVIVGASDYDAGETDEGAAFLFLGSASGVGIGGPGMAHAQLESDQADASFGRSVASAGDVNGDGYADVIVGAPGYDAGELDEGAAFVFLGSAFGIADGDVGSAHAQLESDQADASFGDAVASAGDVNGDGYADVIVGAGDYDAGEQDEGAAFVFLGSAVGIPDGDAGTAHARFESDDDFSRLGRSLSSAGDVNGDGYSDVIVGVQGLTNPQAGEGGLLVFLGSPVGLTDGDPGTADTVIESDTTLGFFGASVAGAGDVNGDGFSDVAASATGGIKGGYVFLGSSTGIPSGNLGLAHVHLDLDNGLIAGAGDVNGDGFGDVVYGTQTVIAYVYLGSAAGITDGSEASAHAIIDRDPGQLINTFRRVAAAGDVNGDGFGDIILGDPIFGNVEAEEGGAFVFHGSPGGPAISPRQLRGDGSGTPVQPGGSANAADAFQVQLVATGRGRANERGKLEIETCAIGVDFDDVSCAIQEGATWVGLSGSPTLTETVSGLDPSTLYRWRARMLYAPFHVTEAGITPPPIPPAGPWRRVQGQAVEGDVRTLPEPGAIGLAAGVLLLAGLARRRRTTP